MACDGAFVEGAGTIVLVPSCARDYIGPEQVEEGEGPGYVGEGPHKADDQIISPSRVLDYSSGDVVCKNEAHNVEDDECDGNKHEGLNDEPQLIDPFLLLCSHLLLELSRPRKCADLSPQHYPSDQEANCGQIP